MDTSHVLIYKSQLIPIEPPTKEDSEPSKRHSKRARTASASNTHDLLITANL